MSKDYFTNPVSEFIWEDKYKGPDDKNISQTWDRIAKALSDNEKEENREKWYKQFRYALADFKVLPGGRVIANAGVNGGHTSTLVNCFVVPEIEDSMDSIFETAKKIALTLKAGGGVGFDVSKIRPANDPVKGLNQGQASGPISFMSSYDNICKVVKAGNRRGAMIAVLRVDHPDIEQFINCKDGTTYLSSMNLSVGITDEFMKAVDSNADFNLVFAGKVYKTVRARELFDKIMKHTYEYSEPGVLFLDTINKYNNLNYCETISAPNPCGEQPMPPGGTCNLISINLTKIVENPFMTDAAIDFKLLARLVATAVRMADNVIDVTSYPLEVYEKTAKNTRRIGLGITGLADMFAMLGFSYDSIDAQRTADIVMRTIKEQAYEASIELAKEKGKFPLYDKKYLNSLFIKSLPTELQTAIAENGIRNSHLLSIQPTGTVSLLANNISSGLEPIFSLKMKRTIKSKDDTPLEFELRDDAYHEALKVWDNSKIEKVFKTISDVPLAAHISIQSILQKHVDAAISKTINVPTACKFEQFKDVYISAYKSAIKGVTTFRPTERMQGVIVDKELEHGESAPKIKLARPYALKGNTYRIKDPKQEHAYYVTINNYIDDASGKNIPWEIFFNSKSEENDQWVKALSVLLSEVFRRVDDATFIADALRMISDAGGGFFENGKFHKSLVARVGQLIHEHLETNNGNIENEEVELSVTELTSFLTFCPRCGERTLRKTESCEDCLNSRCSYSKCG